MKMSIASVLLKWDKGCLDFDDLWYDWFCSSTSLESRGKKLTAKLKTIAESNKFDKDKCYVFYKNNCPVYADLYDDFRICDMETHNVLYTVIPKSPLNNAQVWGKDNNFEKPLVEGTWRDVKKWFLQETK